MNGSFYTQPVSWAKAKDILECIRREVFVREQHVPEDMELDEHDPHCDHLLAYTEYGEAIGTARLLPDGHIGRMAVLAPWRGRGVGSLLLMDIVALAKSKGLSEVILNAQIQAVGFYENHEFHVDGEEFMEAGIPHAPMRRRL